MGTRLRVYLDAFPAFWAFSGACSSDGTVMSRMPLAATATAVPDHVPTAAGTLRGRNGLICRLLR